MTNETTNIADQSAATPIAAEQAATAPPAVNTAVAQEVAMSTANGAGAVDSAAATKDLPPAPDELALLNALKQVVDPELFVNVVDLGLVYAVAEADHKVHVEMTLTSPACPAGPQILAQSKQALEALPGITEATIKLVMTPPWTPDRMTDEARDQLGIF